QHLRRGSARRIVCARYLLPGITSCRVGRQCVRCRRVTLGRVEQSNADARPDHMPERSMSRRILFIAVLVLLYMTSPAHGAPYACTLQSASIAFGNYSSTQNRDAIGNISVYCNGKGRIALRISTGSSSTYLNRTLTGPGGFLNYNLYVD